MFQHHISFQKQFIKKMQGVWIRPSPLNWIKLKIIILWSLIWTVHFQLEFRKCKTWIWVYSKSKNT